MTGRENTSTCFVDREEWPDIAARFADYNYEQSADYSVAMGRRSGGAARFLVLHQGGRLVGAASVRTKRLPLLGRGVAYISGGPLVRCHDEPQLQLGQLEAVLSGLKAKLVDEEGHNLYIRPTLPYPMDMTQLDLGFQAAGFRKSDHLRTYSTVVLDLSQDAERLRQGLHRKWRYNLARSEKEAVSIQFGSDGRFFEQFGRLYEDMKEHKGFDSANTPEAFFRLTTEDLGLRILIAQRGGEPVGGGVLSMLGNTAVDLFSATTNAGRDSRAGYLLYWTAMLYAKEHACRWYDLGGIDRVTNPGSFVFKSQTGGRLVEGLSAYEARPDGLTASLTDKLLMLRNRLYR